MRQALRYLAVASLLALTGCPQPPPDMPPPVHGNAQTGDQMPVPAPPPPPVHGN